MAKIGPYYDTFHGFIFCMGYKRFYIKLYWDLKWYDGFMRKYKCDAINFKELQSN